MIPLAMGSLLFYTLFFHEDRFGKGQDALCLVRDVRLGAANFLVHSQPYALSDVMLI